MILQWIRNWLWRRRRLIFKFWDGAKVRGIDPVEAAIGLHSHPQFLHRHLSEAAKGDSEAQKLVAATACDVFGVRSFNPQTQTGLTVAERIELVMSFDIYLIDLKKNTVRSRTVPSSTESMSVNSPEPTTNATSDSGSIDAVPPFDSPTSTVREH